MSELANNFLKRIRDASGRLGLLKQEPYIPPSTDQIKSSLTAMRELLDGKSKNTDAQIAMVTGKWFEMMARGSAEERVALANDLYILGSGRNANLQLEAPEIVASIEHEYRPLEPTETMIRQVQAPVDLLRAGIQAKLTSLAKTK
jgi:hypothetical protein